VLISQGEVFYTTELLSKLEGMERGPAGNTSLAAAFSIARELEREQILVVQETEYTAAGKLPSSQLTFARENGIEVRRGDPKENVPGRSIVLPESAGQIRAEECDLEKIRISYLGNICKVVKGYPLTREDGQFLAEDINASMDFVRGTLKELNCPLRE
jgi:hypothetical protein